MSGVVVVISIFASGITPIIGLFVVSLIISLTISGPISTVTAELSTAGLLETASTAVSLAFVVFISSTTGVVSSTTLAVVSSITGATSSTTLAVVFSTTGVTSSKHLL